MLDLPYFEKAKVLVVGDVMLDSYWMGPVSRISPEAPVPVLNIADRQRRLGGAANVALNIESLGAEVHLLGFIGDDNQGRYFEACLSESTIESHIIKLPDHATITKLRIISQNQQLIRLDVDNSYASICKNDLLSDYDTLLDTVDLVVLSDYAKGTLSDVQAFISKAKQKGIAVLVDPKGHDFKKYQGATLLTPNMAEFELVAGKCESEDVFYDRGQAYLTQLSLDALLVTRGAKGMMLFQPEQAPLALKANAQEVFDVTGAGDTVIGVLGASLASGIRLPEAVRLANYAAGVVVGHLGASRVTSSDLKTALDSQQILTYCQFKEILRKHRLREEKVKYLYCETPNLDVFVLQDLKALKSQGYYIYCMVDSGLDPAFSYALQSLCLDISFIDDVVLMTQQDYADLNTLVEKSEALL